MDVFKLVFETTIVGLLSFVWLGLAAYLLFPELPKGLLGWIDSHPIDKYKTAIGVGILTLAYCLGSAILPIAKQLVDDEHWPLNEDGIRCQVFEKQQNELKNAAVSPTDKNSSLPRHCSHWAPIFTAEKIGMGGRITRFRRLAFPHGTVKTKEKKTI